MFSFAFFFTLDQFIGSRNFSFNIEGFLEIQFNFVGRQCHGLVYNLDFQICQKALPQIFQTKVK